ncbi:MAG: hypothetical protein ACREAU_06960 [Nitrosopumilaceae archaeon]
MESDAISWKELDTLTKLLSDKINATGKKFNSISTITRGGLVPSRLVADRLDIHEIQVDYSKVDSIVSAISQAAYSGSKGDRNFFWQYIKLCSTQISNSKMILK